MNTEKLRKLREIPIEDLKLGDRVLLVEPHLENGQMMMCISELYTKSGLVVIARDEYGGGEILIEYNRMQDPSYPDFNKMFYLGAKNDSPTTEG